MSSLKLITQDKAGKETLGAADSAGKPPSYDAIHTGPGEKSGSSVRQEDAVHRHPGTGIGPDEGQWHSGSGTRPGDAFYRHPGSGTGHDAQGTGQPGSDTRQPGSGTGQPGSGTGRPSSDAGYPPGGGPGQDDAVHQYSGPGAGPDKGQWHSGVGARPGDASYRHPGVGVGGDSFQRHSGTDRGDPHSRLSGTAPLATGEDLSGGSRPTDIDEAIARASAGGPLGAAGGAGSELPDAVGAGGGGADRPYTRIRQAENVKPILQVLCMIRVNPRLFFFQLS